MMTWFMAITAALLVAEGKEERATQLLALAFAHPLSPTGWLDRWPLAAMLREALEERLGAKAYQQAWKHGERLDLLEVTNQLVAQLNPS